MTIRTLLTGTAVSVAMAMGMASTAQAAFIATIAGNDCPIVFGDDSGGFATCKIPLEYDPNQSPVIAKYDFDTGQWAFNSALFPGVDESDFTWVFGAGGNKTGTWTYTPDPGDPIVTFYVAKAGSSFNLFSNDGDANTGDWFTPGGKGLSHLTWYDTGDESSVVPIPAAAWLLGSGLLGLFGLARRKRAATA